MKVYHALAYVAGPYRDPRGPYYIRQNIRAAEAVGVALWQLGIPALVPHLNTALLDGIVPDEVFLAGDRVMLGRCDLLVLIPGWERSQGAQMERKHAEMMGKPVFLWPEDRDAILRQMHWLEGCDGSKECLRECRP